MTGAESPRHKGRPPRRSSSDVRSHAGGDSNDGPRVVAGFNDFWEASQPLLAAASEHVD